MKITKVQKWSIRFLLFLFIMICSIVIYTVIIKPESSNKEMTRSDYRKIRVACIVGVQARLKHPGSMEITDRSVSEFSWDKWFVEIGVRSKNNFNAMVPSKFTCIVQRVDGDYKLKEIGGE